VCTARLTQGLWLIFYFNCILKNNRSQKHLNYRISRPQISQRGAGNKKPAFVNRLSASPNGLLTRRRLCTAGARINGSLQQTSCLYLVVLVANGHDDVSRCRQSRITVVECHHRNPFSRSNMRAAVSNPVVASNRKSSFRSGSDDDWSRYLTTAFRPTSRSIARIRTIGVPIGWFSVTVPAMLDAAIGNSGRLSLTSSMTTTRRAEPVNDAASEEVEPSWQATVTSY
jgi:hypothetical protein